MLDRLKQKTNAMTTKAGSYPAGEPAASLLLVVVLALVFSLLFTSITLKGCNVMDFTEGFNVGYTQEKVIDEMIVHVEERFGAIDYEVIRFEPSGSFTAYATLYAHVPGIEGNAGDFWVTRYVVDGKSIIREGHEVGDVIFEDSYYRVLVLEELEEHAQSLASEVFPKCKVSVDIRGHFSNDVVAITPMAQAFKMSEDIRCSVVVIVEGEYRSAEDFMEATRPMLQKWLDAGVAPDTSMRCFLMEKGEYDRVDMENPMSVYDNSTYLYDVSIFTRDESIRIVS